MAYTLSNKFAKNCCKRTIVFQAIIKDVVTCFFWNSMEYWRRPRAIDWYQFQWLWTTGTQHL